LIGGVTDILQAPVVFFSIGTKLVKAEKDYVDSHCERNIVLIPLESEERDTLELEHRPYYCVGDDWQEANGAKGNTPSWSHYEVPNQCFRHIEVMEDEMSTMYQ
jgi:hypothetical protein